MAYLASMEMMIEIILSGIVPVTGKLPVDSGHIILYNPINSVIQSKSLGKGKNIFVRFLRSHPRPPVEAFHE